MIIGANTVQPVQQDQRRGVLKLSCGVETMAVGQERMLDQQSAIQHRLSVGRNALPILLRRKEVPLIWGLVQGADDHVNRIQCDLITDLQTKKARH
ncbi:hypothetical protein EBB79_02235 [Parasedimentitalea marina]|uniref:Uncharacterized protein n=1 Tax=Parasedimentitalea marina TaxID=2483033 RepID=A0A3T0MYM4_9RHOB|nr:hypothetical protein [Parasedimentitalea marina]AZV76829.1 hypothetical protein EBB79_02235 [Parasedimentitalea marina]